MTVPLTAACRCRFVNTFFNTKIIFGDLTKMTLAIRARICYNWVKFMLFLTREKLPSHNYGGYNCLKDILTKPKYGALDLVTLMWRASPFYAVIATVIPLVSALIPTITIFATAAFIDGALAVVAGTQTVGAIAAPVGVLLAVTLYSTITGIAGGLIDCRRTIFLRKTLRPVILARVAALEYKHIENQDSADLLSRVVPEFDTKIHACFEAVIQIARTIISILGVIITLTLSVW
jgi:ABC-type multidrug transport system fused ATPase/permease subunit